MLVFQKKAQESTPVEIASSTQVAPICSGHSGLLTPSRSKPAPISPHFQAPRVRSIGPADISPSFVEFQDNLYNLKDASEDDSSFKSSDESEDSDNSNSDDGRDVEEITPSSFGRELVEHEDAESLPSGPCALTSTPGNSDFNDVRERTRKLNMVDERPLILLMKDKPTTNVLPLLVLLDLASCPNKASFVKSRIESYKYFVLGGTHSLVARKELCAEYPFVESYKIVLAWVYAGLSDEDAKTLALDHNVDLKMRLSMSFLQKVRYFHNEWVDHLRQAGCQAKHTRFQNFFQLAFCDGDLWEHQEEIFKLWEEGKVKGQRVKLPTSAQRSRGGSEEALKPIPDDMKITPWCSMHGIREKHIILPILARVQGGALSLDEKSKEFEKQKTFLYMQRIMIEKLNCKDWNEVQTHHPTTSHHSALEHFIFLFKVTRNLRALIKSIPQEFEQHLGRARAERRRLEDAENIVNNPDISTFVSDDITTLPIQYSVFEGKVENMESFVPRRHYTLGIADAPYGFKAPHSINDDVKYGLSAYKKVIEAFKKVTSAESWVLVIFHAHDQISATKKAFVDNSMVHQLCIWTKPNIKGTTTVSALKKGRNVVVVEMDPLQVRFIQQRVTALKELSDEFQEVGMKNMAAQPRVVDASDEPQPGFGLDDEMQFVDLEPYEEPNLMDATGGSGHGDGGGEDDSSPSGGEDEEDKDEEHEEFPIKP
ncbi:hypothetical protein L7F22_009009 [Adiantum nelumboides]|nr:hypothetical protein [Adiantum nelumboides]